MKTVTVLVSTYNGQKYLSKQLDSLISQVGVDMKIIVRDDGSSDGTRQILRNYAQTYSNIQLLFEDNCGAEESFNKLCQYSLQQDLTDYYAFCDQDDVWDNDKLSIAIQSLEKFDHLVPNLYFSNLRMVDDTLSYIRDFYNEKEVDIDNKLSLVQIFTYGCTCVFNQSALSIYCKVNNKSFHDNWIYIICSFMGNVFYDSSAHIQYRQHSSNLSGHKTTGLGLLRSRLYRPFKGNLGHDFEFLAIQLLQVSFENTLSDKYKIARNIANYRTNIISRLFLFFSPSYCTGNFVKDLCIRYRILFNCL